MRTRCPRKPTSSSAGRGDGERTVVAWRRTAELSGEPGDQVSLALVLPQSSRPEEAFEELDYAQRMANLEHWQPMIDRARVEALFAAERYNTRR